jgi:serine/threonine protein kinase
MPRKLIIRKSKVSKRKVGKKPNVKRRKMVMRKKGVQRRIAQRTLKVNDIHKAIMNGNVLTTFTRTINPYRYSTFIGKGASGQVYELENETTKVIKIQNLRHPLEKYGKDDLSEEDLYIRRTDKVIVKEPAIIEVFVMQHIINYPAVYDFGMYYDQSSSTWKSYIVMDKVSGVSLLDRSVSIDLLNLYRIILLKMKNLYDQYKFVHGDLNFSGNMMYDPSTGDVNIIDFGTSTFIYEGLRYIPAHVFERITTSLRVTESKKTLEEALDEVISGVDICKILQMYRNFDPEFEAKLDGCTGTHGRSRNPDWTPSLIVRSQIPLTYDEALYQVDKASGRL